MLQKFNVRLLVAAIGTTAAAAIIMALSLASSQGAEAQGTDSRPARSAADVFAVFRSQNAQGAGDGEAGRRLTASLQVPGGPPSELDAATTRTTSRLADGTPVRVIAGRDEYCVMKGSKSFTCARVLPRNVSGRAEIIALGAGYSEPVETAQFTAMVSDGVRNLRLEVEGTRAVDLVPANNVVAVDVPGRPVTLTWTNPDGTAGELRFLER